MESFEKNWYVLHTYSGYENKVKANIESRAQSMKMADFIFRVVVPEEKETEVKNGKEKEKRPCCSIERSCSDCFTCRCIWNLLSDHRG